MKNGRVFYRFGLYLVGLIAAVFMQLGYMAG